MVSSAICRVFPFCDEINNCQVPSLALGRGSAFVGRKCNHIFENQGENGKLDGKRQQNRWHMQLGLCFALLLQGGVSLWECGEKPLFPRECSSPSTCLFNFQVVLHNISEPWQENMLEWWMIVFCQTLLKLILSQTILWLKYAD